MSAEAARSALAPIAPEWFPDWRGKAVAIVACGPSAKKANLKALRGRMPVLAIKEAAVDLCPWADVVYGCDSAWWIHRRGLPEFKGLKICWARDVPSQFPGVHSISIKLSPKARPHDPQYANEMLFDQPGVVGGGHNSGFQANNLAAQFGAAKLLLVGFDLHDHNGSHYYGRNNWFRANNPDRYQFERCIAAFNAAVRDLKKLGVEVVNASPDSALTCFPKMTVEQALLEWGL